MSVDSNGIYANISAGVSTALATISTVGSLQDRPPQVTQPVSTVLADALAAVQAGIDAYDADISLTTVGNVTVGPAAPDLTPLLLTQCKDMLQLATLLQMKSYLGRAYTNVILEPN